MQGSEGIKVIDYQQQDWLSFVLLIQDAASGQNLVINLADTATEHLSATWIKELLALSKKQKKSKKSFVVVSSQVDIDQIPDQLVVVPTLDEAYDMISMEELARELGF